MKTIFTILVGVCLVGLGSSPCWGQEVNKLYPDYHTNPRRIDLDTLNARGSSIVIGDGDETIKVTSSDWTISLSGTLLNTDWQGDVIGIAYGGTGVSALSDILAGNGITVTAGASRIIGANATIGITNDGVGAAQLNSADVEAELEGVLDLEDLQGAVTDGQVPNDITVTNYLPLAGGTMTGDIIMDDGGTPEWIGISSEGGHVSFDDASADLILFSNAYVGINVLTANLDTLFEVEGDASIHGHVKTGASGDLWIGGDDLYMATNTDAYMLVADGTNYNPVAISGELNITNTGATTIDLDDMVKSFVIQSPDTDHDFTLWKTPVAITIDSVFGRCTAGTNVVGGLDEYDWDDDALVAVVNADWTFTTSYQAIGSFTNAGIDAKNHVRWHTTSVSGEVTFFQLTIWYHED